MVVLAVAAFAAVVSYSHIYDLGRTHGQAGVAALLLPLSVDGLILAASLVVLMEARAGRTAAPVLARVMLGLGVAATIAVNVLVPDQLWVQATSMFSDDLAAAVSRRSGRSDPACTSASHAPSRSAVTWLRQSALGRHKS